MSNLTRSVQTKKSQSLEARDWGLLALNCAPNGELSPVQLQKALFLLSDHFPKELGAGFYKFEPYNFGPFDATIYTDMQMMGFERYVRRVPVASRTWSTYRITDEGKKLAKGLRSRAPQTAIDYLQAVTRWVTSLSFPQLLRAIYAKYPKYRKNSVFQD